MILLCIILLILSLTFGSYSLWILSWSKVVEDQKRAITILFFSSFIAFVFLTLLCGNL